MIPDDLPRGNVKIKDERPAVRFLASLIEQAGVEYSKGELAKSLELYDQAVLIDPNNNVLYANRSAILFKLCRTEEALKDANQAIDLEPKWAKSYYRKAEALKEIRLFIDAIFAYCQAIHLDPNRTTFVSALCECVLKKKFQTALKQMSELGMDKNPFVMTSVVGQEFLAAEKYDTAISILKIAVKIDSPSLKLKQSTFGALAHAYYKVKNYTKAVEYTELQLELAVRLSNSKAFYTFIIDDKSQATIHENISQLAVLDGNLELAIAHKKGQIKQKTLLEESVDENLCDLAELCLLNQDFENSEQYFQEALTVDRDCTRAFVGLGDVFTEQNDSIRAMEYFDRAEKAAKLLHEKVDVLLAKCKSLLHFKQSSQALATLKSLTYVFPRLNSNSRIIGSILGLMGVCYLINGDCLKAKAYAKRMLKIGIEGNFQELVLNGLKILSDIYDKNGLLEDALKLAEKQLESLGSFDSTADQKIPILRKQSRLLLQLGNTQKAVEILQSLLSMVKGSRWKSIQVEACLELVKVYRKWIDHKMRENYLEKAQKLLTANPELLDECEFMYLEEFAEYNNDMGCIEEAKKAFERALMLVQELDNPIKEIELSLKLGRIHSSLGEDDEALVYYQQGLTVSSMLMAYSYVGEIHAKLGNWDDALECHKYHLTLAKIQNDRHEKLNALLRMGKAFNKKMDYTMAIKVLSKAKWLGEILNAKEELARCYGYLGECHMAMKNQTKAFSNFAKQFSLFSYLTDVEGKYETIKHLIREQSKLGDVESCKKLGQLLRDVSREGSPSLQISSLLECATLFYELDCQLDNIQCLENALMLALRNEHSETVTILLKLCDSYEKNQFEYKAIRALNEFLASHGDLCGPDVYLRLSSLLLKIDRLERAKEVLQECKRFHDIEPKFHHMLACVYSRTGDYRNALVYMNEFLQKLEEDEDDRIIYLFERSAIRWLSGEIPLASAETRSYLISTHNCFKLCFHLDAIDAYSFIDALIAERLEPLAKLHWEMSRGNWINAKRLLKTDFYHESLAENSLDSLVVDFFLEETIEFEDSMLGDVLQVRQEEEESCLFHYDDDYKETIWTILWVLNNPNDMIASLRKAECLQWSKERRKFKRANREFCRSMPTFEIVESKTMEKDSFIYVLQAGKINLVWIKRSKCDHIRLYFTSNLEEKFSKMPKFYANLLQKLVDSSGIEYILPETLEIMMKQVETLIGPSRNEANIEHLLSLTAMDLSKDSDLCETAILVLSDKDHTWFDHDSILKLSVNSFDERTMRLIARSKVVYVDGKNLLEETMDPVDLLRYDIKAELVIFINLESMDIVENLLLAGTKNVIVVDNNDKQDDVITLLAFKMGEASWSLDELRDMHKNIRIYGPKSQKISIESISMSLRHILDSYNGPTFLKMVGDLKQAVEWQNFISVNYSYIQEKMKIELSSRLSEIANLLCQFNESERSGLIKSLLHRKPSIKYTYTSEYEEVLEPRLHDFSKLDIKEKLAINRLYRIIYADKTILLTMEAKHDDQLKDLTEIMKKYENRKRRSRRGKVKMPTRGYSSEGEDQAEISYVSDCDLTDVESISGARVLAVDLNDETTSLY